MFVVTLNDENGTMGIYNNINHIFSTKDNEIMIEDMRGGLTKVCKCSARGEVYRELDYIFNTMLHQDGLHNNNNIFLDLRSLQDRYKKLESNYKKLGDSDD